MKIEISEDTEESVEELERLMMVIRKENNVEKWVNIAMREVKGIKAEMSMLPAESKMVKMMYSRVDAYEKELESIMGRQRSCSDNSNSNSNNDVCMLLKQPHTPKPHHTTTTTTTNANTSATLLLCLLILFLITYILYTYTYIYKHN